MDYYEADNEDGFEDIEETDLRPHQSDQEQQQQTHTQIPYFNDLYHINDLLMDEDSVGEDSDYSLDYEYLGPRHPVYRDQNDADSDASELSCNSNDDVHSSTSSLTGPTEEMEESAGFDMWDEDPYSTNDFTWESNDMRLTRFIKAKKQDLLKVNKLAPWKTNSSFWRKEKGWPRQLPYSSTTTNHDQSANALCLVPSNYALGEQLYGIYRDRIVKCGRCWSSPLTSVIQHPMIKLPTNNDKLPTTTWIDSDHNINSMETGSTSLYYPSCSNTDNKISDPSSSSTPSSSSDGSKFCSTHISVSLKRSSSIGLHSATKLSPNTGRDEDGLAATTTTTTKSTSPINNFIPYTKYIKRAEFTPPTGQQHAYVGLSFEPLCLERKYGFMAIGGLEGEFELYCCMDSDHPIKIWGTKFKGRDNIMLMTNAIQIVRWKRTDSNRDDDDTKEDEYDYFLFACMNEAGILVYRLPPHHQCITKQQQQTTGHLYAHLQSFDHVPINDAKVSPDGTKMICVGDDRYIFMINISHHSSSSFDSHDSTDNMSIDDCVLTFSAPVKLSIPISLLGKTDPSSATNVQPISSTHMEVDGHAHSFNTTDDHSQSTSPYSSQHVVWNHSSEYFAHTSDTHHRVLVWRASTLDILCSIDAAGYTYAIKFHPYLDGVLAFTNRYGYFHTVDLNQALDTTTSSLSSILDFDRQTAETRGHTCNPHCIKEINIPASVSAPTPAPAPALSFTSSAHSSHHHHHSAHHTNHMKPRHEMTMVAFRGEKDRRLRILAKINGIQWSQDGCYLYVATKKRVLAYEFIFWSQQHVQSLFGLAGQTIRQFLEDQPHNHQQRQRNHQERKRKKGRMVRGERKKRQGHDQDGTTDSSSPSFGNDHHQKWHQHWFNLPQHIRYQVLKETNLSSHW